MDSFFMLNYIHNTALNKIIPINKHTQVYPVDFQESEVVEPNIIAATKNMTAIINISPPIVEIAS